MVACGFSEYMSKNKNSRIIKMDVPEWISEESFSSFKTKALEWDKIVSMEPDEKALIFIKSFSEKRPNIYKRLILHNKISKAYLSAWLLFNANI